jgi:TP901 family phage tail tape measure protein
MASVIEELFVVLGVKPDPQARQKMDSFLGTVRSALTDIRSIGAGVMTAIAVPAMTVSRETTRALALTGLQGQAFADMREKLQREAVRLAIEMGVSAGDVAKAFVEITQKGISPTESSFLDFVRIAIQTKKLLGVEVPQTVEVLTKTLAAFQIPSQEVGNIMDKIFSAARASGTSFQEFTNALITVLPEASALGISLDEVLTLLSGFAQRGIEGAEAGTALRLLLQRLSTDSKTVQEALGRLGISLFDNQGQIRNLIDVVAELSEKSQNMTDQQRAMIFNLIFGERVMGRASSLLRLNARDFLNLRDSIRQGSGALAQAGKMMETASFSWMPKLVTQTKNLATIMGQSAGAFDQIGGALLASLKFFTEFVDRNRDVVSSLLDFIVVIGILFILIKVIQSLRTAFILLWGTIRAHPLQVLLTALILVLQELQAVFDPKRLGLLEEISLKYLNFLQTILDTAKEIVDTFKSLFAFGGVGGTFLPKEFAPPPTIPAPVPVTRPGERVIVGPGGVTINLNNYGVISPEDTIEKLKKGTEEAAKGLQNFPRPTTF